jgi:hypothetical protein
LASLRASIAEEKAIIKNFGISRNRITWRLADGASMVRPIISGTQRRQHIELMTEYRQMVLECISGGNRIFVFKRGL